MSSSIAVLLVEYSLKRPGESTDEHFSIESGRLNSYNNYV